MARAASLLTEFLGFCFYLHRRGGVLGCGPEALPSNLKARRYGKPEQSNTATQRDFWAGRGGARRGGAGLSAEPSGLSETLAPDPLRGSGQSRLQS